MGLGNFLSKNILKPLRRGLSAVGLWIRITIVGDRVSSRFFWRYRTTTMVCMIGLFLSVAMRFQCIAVSSKAERLEEQINVMRTEKQYQAGIYKSKSRESVIMQRVDSLHLGLTVPDRHPQILKNARRR